MQMPIEDGILSIHGKGIYPYQYKKVHYFENPEMAFRFLPNPFHPPFDRVSLVLGKGRIKTVPLITEAVPDEIAHLPQYSRGLWSYPKGFCPYKPKRRWFGFF
jgi:type IV secretion system protein VirD4